jgi:hypothetical protein
MAPAKRSTEGRSRVPLLLGLAAVVAGVLLWDRWADWGTSVVSAPGVAALDKTGAVGPGGQGEPAGAEGGPHPLASLSLDTLRDTVRRPLFEKTRRPVEPPPRATAAPAPVPVVPKRTVDPNALTLLGILTSEGQGTGAIALMRRNQTGQNVRLQEGDTVDGWTIERIESARVHIRQGDAKAALELFRKR